ncbi:hypothetical protein ARMSODRAFT_1087504 [Armillaria solidipes]|uniref:DUF6534 domain-containing protein n=1 Tax=Armillaria solidipes TaxID=1076256 RepID=A0A2H3BQM1_9AGAR|nr:hypothetical protein ARMSODRAFT_1087504 [Armillaria solidipes]
MALGGALHLDNTVGAFEIAVTIASLLFGVYSYTVTHRGDIDVLVGFYTMEISHASRPSIQRFVLKIETQGLVTASGFVAFIVQSFYVYRIWRREICFLFRLDTISCMNYSQQWKLSSDLPSGASLISYIHCSDELKRIQAAISVAEFIVNMYAVDGARRITVYADQVKIKPYLLAYNGLGVVEDCLLAGTMMLLLLKSRTRSKKTNTMITRLTMYCVNTGIFTSMAALFTIITLAIWDETMIDHPFYFALPRLYGASLFGLLNARNDIRNGTPNNGYSSNEIPLSLARSAHTAAAPIQSLSMDAKPSHIMVSVSRETDGHDERSLGKERDFESV